MEAYTHTYKSSVQKLLLIKRHSPFIKYCNQEQHELAKLYMYALCSKGESAPLPQVLLALWMDVHNCIATLSSCDHTQEIVGTGFFPC